MNMAAGAAIQRQRQTICFLNSKTFLIVVVTATDLMWECLQCPGAAFPYRNTLRGKKKRPQSLWETEDAIVQNSLCRYFTACGDDIVPI